MSNRVGGGYYFGIRCDKTHQWINLFPSKCLCYNTLSFCTFWSSVVTCSHFMIAFILSTSSLFLSLIPSLLPSLSVFLSLSLSHSLLEMRAYYETTIGYYTNSTLSNITVHSAWSDTKMVPLVDLCDTNKSQLHQTTFSDVSSAYATDGLFLSPLTMVGITQSSLLSPQSEIYHLRTSYSTYTLFSATTSYFLMTDLTSTSHFSSGLVHSVCIHLTFPYLFFMFWFIV